MLINGVELSSLGVQLYDRVISSNKVNTTSQWLEGDIQPTFIRQQDKFKTIQLKFLVTEKDEDKAFIVMSKLTSMLRKASIIFDDIDLIFDVNMRGSSKQDRLKNGNFILTVKLESDYAKGATEVYTTDTVATDYFKLKILYYQDGNYLISSDEQIIRASDFNEFVNTFESLGINLNKYKPDYYNAGTVSNFNKILNYANLKDTQTLIVNYSPVVYSKAIEYFLKDDDGMLVPTEETTFTFTKKQVDEARNLGELINLSTNKPDGYSARTNFVGDFTFENLLSFSPLQVYFEKIENEKSKEVTITYTKQDSNGEYIVVDAAVVVVRESNVVEGSKLKDFINLNRFKPEKYYGNGYTVGADYDSLVSYADIAAAYEVRYDLLENTVFVEYYYGTYPSWSRISTATYKIKYDSRYDDSADIVADLGLNLDKYYVETYEHGVIYGETLSTFDDVINIGVIQVYYTPKNYTLSINYTNEDGEIIDTKEVLINDTMFFNDPSLAAVIDVNAARPEGYIFDEENSYSGDVSLGSLLANAPITIAYKPVEQIRTKSIVIKYKQELASAFSTINTSILTIEEAQVGGGVRLYDLFDLNAYRPEYYDAGIINGYSSTSLFTFDELQGQYEVLYMASSYSTQVRYYTDEVANENWIGSQQLKYTVLDFSTDTTLIDLGLNINAFKPSYCGDGEVQYTGPITFSALRNVDAINIVYMAESEPIDPDGIDYPHRILFLQHNDMGNYESDYPTWTLNHAYINTGVTCSDMSKLTVLVDTYRVFDTEPLYNVNVNDAYLFGSITPNGSYYIKYVNNTKFKPESQLTGVNTFNVAAGLGTPELVLEETSSEGFSANTGITASTRDGYSYGTLTFTHLVQSNAARMDVPLYLFACNMNGFYRGGIAGVGIKSCKIYYDNVLIRDFIPVQFYDKIGDKIAPSNCLYDKVTQSFFEDATGMESFNIMDDDSYTDTNPEHNIGHCYANYYQGETLFNTATVWFRESDFVNGNTWDPYEKLFVDYYQPQYYNAGQIKNLTALGDVTFNNVKNYIFNIVYEVAGYHITVNYWKDNQDDEANLIATEDISLTEKDFLSVPEIGNIIDIQKYKLESYKPVFEYPDTRVTLRRVLEHSPYNIVYERVENPEIYTTEVTYYRKRFGITPLAPLDSYEKLGTIEVQIDETQFANGVYVDKFINLNAMYPVSPVQNVGFYAAGAPWEWYLEDEMLNTPEDLKAQYKVVYDPVYVPIEIRYYTDEVDEDNLVASAIWNVKIDDWPDGEQFQVIDEIPNKYIDAFKPVICWGGILAEPDRYYTFTSLVEIGHIDILYMTKEEPHDPDNSDFPQKVLWFNKSALPWTKLPVYIPGKYGGLGGMDGGYGDDVSRLERNIDTPYIDLGYTPKEIGRLRSELKGYSANAGLDMGGLINQYSYSSHEYSYFFGYQSATEINKVYEAQGNGTPQRDGVYISGLSSPSKGQFAYHGHTVQGQSLVYTNSGPQLYDGHDGHNMVTDEMNSGYNLQTVREMGMYFRRGQMYIKNEDLEDVLIYPVYGRVEYGGYGVYDDGYYHDSADPNGSPWRTPNEADTRWGQTTDLSGGQRTGGNEYPAAVVFNPITGILDAYNSYVETYDYENSARPYYENFENKDIDIFTYRCQPKGTITLFVTRNPDSGDMNWLPAPTVNYMSFFGFAGLSLQQAGLGNPYTPTFNPSVTYTQQVITGTMDDGTPIYENVTKTRNFAYSTFTISGQPVPFRSMIWYLKLWDRNKLVRDLIPVEQGDQIYDFIAPTNGLFDKVTEIFFTNNNEGGTYKIPLFDEKGRFSNWSTTVINANDVFPLQCAPDPTIYGKIVVNYYDENNHFIDNQYIVIPVHYNQANVSMANLLHYNDYKPNDFYHDGMLDVDGELKDINKYLEEEYEDEKEDKFLKDIYKAGAINIYYKLLTFTKTVVYYQGDTRVGSKDLFYNLQDIKDARTLSDLGIDVNLYASDDYQPGKIIFNEQILADDDIKAFIDAPSPIVVYEEYPAEERPDLLYVNYYRESASDPRIANYDERNVNYFRCDPPLTGKVMNPKGVIKYANHYHTALYEDEKQDYFIAYQVDVQANYVDIHKGPGRAYNVLASITDKGRYTVIEEKRGWGRLKEYPKGWILLSYTKPTVGPGQYVDYENDPAAVTIPFEEEIEITQMTIDRLWGFVPQENCWVKIKELSLDQAGSLQNALARQVIHLDEIEDWSAIESLEDLGIYKNKWKMKYHNDTEFEDPREFTYETLSADHSYRIVYPETVYAYNVDYYEETTKAIKQGDLIKPGLVTFLYDNKHDNEYYYYKIYKQPSTSSEQLRSIQATSREGYSYSFTLLDESSAFDDFYHVEHTNSNKVTIQGYLSKTVPIAVQGVEIVQPQFALHDDDPKVDTISFSCSVSDWNPDWETFIRTSWQYDMTSTEGEGKILGLTSVPLKNTTSNASTTLVQVPSGSTVAVLSNLINSNWYQIRYNDYVGYVSKDSINITQEYVEEIDYSSPINPTLYRDTELTLTWDFFGIDKNAFKFNEEWDDGLFLWNPRSWENNDVYFTFEELITTGSQKVLYLPTYEKYKAAYYFANTEVPVDINNFSISPGVDGGLWDYEIKVEKTHDREYFSQRPWNESYPQAAGETSFFYDTAGYANSSGYYYRGHNYVKDPTSNVYYGILNFSNKRKASAVYSYGNDLTNYQAPYYVYDRYNKVSTEIKKNVNLKNSNFYQYSDMDTIHAQYDLTVPWYVKDAENQTVEGYAVSGTNYLTYSDLTTPKVIYYIKVWKNHFLQHYYIPLPKGYECRNGLRIPYNTLYDVITGTYCRSGYTARKLKKKQTGYADEYMHVKFGYPELFKVGTEIIKGSGYDWFERWEEDTPYNYSFEDSEYIVQMTEDSTSYEVPDLLSRERVTLENNLVVPTDGYTREEWQNGEWYRSYDQNWFETSHATILPSRQYDIQKAKGSICLKDRWLGGSSSAPGQTRNYVRQYNSYLTPDLDNAYLTAQKYTTETVADYYAESTDSYFLGWCWVPKAITNEATEDVNIDYVVSANTLDVYDYPIKDSNYRNRTLLSGERITATKQLTFDPYWQYIGYGWIDTENTVAEIE